MLETLLELLLKQKLVWTDWTKYENEEMVVAVNAIYVIQCPKSVADAELLSHKTRKHVLPSTILNKMVRETASIRPLFRASRPGYEKNTISIEFKYHSTQKAS